MRDLLLDNNQELDIQNGDFVVDESSLQHQDLLLMTSKGEWKENPLIAVGVLEFLKDEDASGMLSEIKIQFEKDGMDVKSVAIVDEKLLINAQYRD